MSENTSSSKKRKVISATLTVAMVTTMLLSGTLAYFYQSLAVNTFKEEATVKNVIAHDDFDPVTGNKDIYVENAGTSPVYVRIKLTEDYQEKDSDGNYAYKEHFGVNPKYTELDLHGGEMNHGLPSARDTAIIAAHDAFHENYFSWTWGTKGKTYLKAGNNEETNSYGSDPTKDQYFDTTNKIAYDRINAGEIYVDPGNNSSVYGTTQDSDGVITDVEWNALDREASAGTAEEKLTAAKEKSKFTGWVMDTGTGYYHWSQPLLPGQATGLLLDQVDKEGLIKSQDASYQYNIHVQFEAVDEVDCGLWTDDAQSAPYDEHSDAWLPTISEKASYTGGIRSLLDMQRFKTSVNVDAIVTEIQALIDEYKALKYENASNDHNGESLTSAQAISLLEDAKLGIYYSSFANKTGNAAVEEMNRAVGVQRAYKEDKIKYFESDKEEDNPDKVVFETMTTGLNKDVINDLIERYGADGKLTKSQAASVTTLHIGGRSESRKMTVDNLDFVLTDNTFPNVESLEIQYANLNSSITSLSGLPQKLKKLYVGYNSSALISIDVSDLKLARIQILNTNGYKQLNADGLVGLNDSKDTLTYADLRGFKFDSGVNLDDFTKLRTLYLCGVSSISLSNCISLEMIDITYNTAKSSLTELDLEDCRNLKTAKLSQCDVLQKLTISENAVITDVAHFPLYVKQVTYGAGGTNTYTYKKYTSATTIEDADPF